MSLKLLNNRYQLVQAIATGGFGQTFLAEDTHLPSRRRCLLKQLKPVAHNPQAYQLIQERFAREAAILEKLGNSHDQIPDLYAYFEEGGQFYLVQEWIEGQTLTEKLQREVKLSESTVRDILINILPVIDYVHTQGIIHRDIKPDNIILRQRDNKPILIDFGAVKETMTTVLNSQGNPTHSMVIGTPGFMPSEQAAGRPIFSSDLYSLGLTAIYLLTGKLPQELQVDSQTGELIWRQNAPNINRNLATVLDKAIRSHPRDRFSTARQMLDALQTSPTPVAGVPLSQQETIAVSPGGASTQAVKIPHPSNRSREWKKAAIIAGGIVGAAFIIGIAIAKSRQPIAPQPVVKKDTSSAIENSPTSTPSTSNPVTAKIPSPAIENSPTSTPSTPNPVSEKTPPPSATQEPINQNRSRRISTRGLVPGFPVGTPESTVRNTLGNPSKITKGVWKNTRAVLYEDFVPSEVSLGYLFDRNTQLLRQTEVAFAPSVDSESMFKTLNEMLGSPASREIKLQLERVYKREKNRYSFAVGDLKGVIERNDRDRIYIGIWDRDLH
ncbi:protein kinase [Planktothrix sp. FACHB-1355]|uniref:non-specific serine/threonine protein kinase n=1 Tax=Aerosakkonema funiforme FACHB-1375 TaxID=2949571 RepID=A0A926VAD3_9CYAN|nr:MULTISPECIES: protein kinase [Oscillatoriales]MBD2179733.1 protein kinase [Aerosakkonema funiforme FACHB-1375]MBD3561661.1 protein kinase [Planktothrix sp. FACHB-1355]